MQPVVKVWIWALLPKRALPQVTFHAGKRMKHPTQTQQIQQAGWKEQVFTLSWQNSILFNTSITHELWKKTFQRYLKQFWYVVYLWAFSLCRTIISGIGRDLRRSAGLPLCPTVRETTSLHFWQVFAWPDLTSIRPSLMEIPCFSCRLFQFLALLDKRCPPLLEFNFITFPIPLGTVAGCLCP